MTLERDDDSVRPVAMKFVTKSELVIGGGHAAR